MQKQFESDDGTCRKMKLGKSQIKYIQEAEEFSIVCSILCVNEIMTFVSYGTYKEALSRYDGAELSLNYWQEVKDELEKL